MNYRTEWKYICTHNELVLIENKIKQLLPLDSHIKDDKYIVHSLYFDDYLNTCMFDNDAGSSKRFKYRIRYYDSNTNHLVFEKKQKEGMFGHKTSCLITRQDYEKLISGKEMEVFWNTNNDDLKKFCLEIKKAMFRPKVIIEYERTAYVEPITNVRVTLDRNISASTEINKFLDGAYTKYPLQNKDKHLLEIKFDYILPGHIKQAAYIDKLQQVTFSKYYLSRSILERN